MSVDSAEACHDSVTLTTSPSTTNSGHLHREHYLQLCSAEKKPTKMKSSRTTRCVHHR